VEVLQRGEVIATALLGFFLHGFLDFFDVDVVLAEFLLEFFVGG
jgi:hypothetical protein